MKLKLSMKILRIFIVRRSSIDDYYPSRPKELESLNLYNFARFWEIMKQVPKNDEVKCYKLVSGLCLKKRKKCYLINYYQFNVKTES